MLPFSNPMIGQGGGLRVESAFATTLYTENGTAQKIAIPFAPDLIWLKSRNTVNGNYLFDRIRGNSNKLESNTPNAQVAFSNGSGSLLSDGFLAGTNANGQTMASWSFRRTKRFFDVVSYTGNGAATRQIPHNLGIEPGIIIVKSILNSSQWFVYHRSLGSSFYLILNTTAGAEGSASLWGGSNPNSVTFGVTGSGADSSFPNATNISYIAYLFAHDPSAQGIINCGSYIGNGSSTGPLVSLGWEPQWLLIKSRNSQVQDWSIQDNKRGASGTKFVLRPNTNDSESNLSVDFLPSGFQIKNSLAIHNVSGGNYIYMAIRKGFN